mmetsp:Transcript_76958/g.213877  ORF Transcript_76958/g.213877 Transcript_76958/m.213877 type:complete len:432 (-) Transcript_76958:236-1531(-)|eukprot:CAMPEP_0117525390 /NCGR_PEP_ID=MMETSP0784-20121206/35744_1 /TAXON_ID=39447 /ORGANISM="" /LENGTH=431 /DNA_ID=CAMNT_0005321583 /DNA_START=124 /DNA_END=1419 /DNA_ORIENTATION=+
MEVAGCNAGGLKSVAKQKTSRAQRWRAVMQQGIDTYVKDHRDRFCSLVQRGIPTEYRWEVWRAAVGVEKRVRPGLYQELLQVQNQWTRLVEIDIPRTFPDMPLFDKEQQHSLLRILHAYTNVNPEVGYCQGMNFVAGLLMLVCQNEDFRETPRLEKEEETFWMFVCLMEDRRLSGFYRRRFPLLRRYLWAFDELMAQFLPELRDHFREESVAHAVYLHQWFLTLYINCLPLPMVLVFWDALVCVGLERMLPITVALLEVMQQTLLAMQFEDILRFFKHMRLNEDVECDTSAIARHVVARAEEIIVPAHVVGCIVSPEVGTLDGDMSPEASCPERHGVADVAGDAAADNAAVSGVLGTRGWSFQFAAASLGRFGDLGLELPQGVLSAAEGGQVLLERAAGWWEGLHAPRRGASGDSGDCGGDAVPDIVGISS